MEISASRCLFWVSSQVSLSAMTSKFSTSMSAINSSIFGDSDCTLAVSTFSRLFGCISLPVFVGGGFPGGGGRSYIPVEFEVLLVVVTLGSPYRSCWLQLFVLLVMVPAGYCPYLLVVIGCVTCGHPCILLIIIDLFLFCPSILHSPIIWLAY